MTTRTLDEVVDELSGIVAWAHGSGSRAGYFAALYRRVTLQVREWVHDGRFDDGPRMARLDALFADRYLEAYRRWRAGEPTTASWRVAFEAVDDWWPIVLQHLLLGMNAHINLDLGIATARCVPADDLHALERDFFRITQLLCSMVDDVQEGLTEIWPLLGLVDRIGGLGDEATIHFSIDRARSEAWHFARRLAGTPEDAWQPEIRRTDTKIAALGCRVRNPGRLLGAKTMVVRLGEVGTVSEVIDVLSGARAGTAAAPGSRRQHGRAGS